MGARGIQRGYGLTEKRFSLFNVARWGDVRQAACSKCHLSSETWAPALCERCKSSRPPEPPQRPECCHVVPVLGRGLDIRTTTECALGWLREAGSAAAPGFRRPEGVVVFHAASGQLFKVTLERDQEPKGE